MSLKGGLRSFLVADAGVAGQVGERIGQRAAQGWQGKAYVTFRQIAEAPRRHLRGATSTETFLELRCTGGTPEEAEAVAAAVHAAIGRDGLGGVAWDETFIELARWDNRTDDDTEPLAGEERGIFQVSLTLVVWHRPA